MKLEEKYLTFNYNGIDYEAKVLCELEEDTQYMGDDPVGIKYEFMVNWTLKELYDCTNRKEIIADETSADILVFIDGELQNPLYWEA